MTIASDRLLDRAEQALWRSDVRGRLSTASLFRQLLCELGGHEFAYVLSPSALYRVATKVWSRIENPRYLFRIVGLPFLPPRFPIRAGDWMLRVMPGAGVEGHFSLLASDDLLAQSSLGPHGILGEGRQPGYYGIVIESGAFPHDRMKFFARRFLDSRGRLPAHTVILRPNSNASDRPTPVQNGATEHPLARTGEPDPGAEERFDSSAIPKEVADALAASDWPRSLQLAIRSGWHDENDLTDLIFFARHPELPSAALDPKDPKFKQQSAEWSTVLKSEVRPAIEQASQDTDLVVSGKYVAERDPQFRGAAGTKFRELVDWAAREVDLNPGFLGAVLLAEWDQNTLYLGARAVPSFQSGTDDFYESKAQLAANVPAFSKVQFDEASKTTNRNEHGRVVTTIRFNSGKDAALATAVYLKYAEIKIRKGAKKNGGDFDSLPPATRFALVRIAMAAGHGGIAPDGTFIRFKKLNGTWSAVGKGELGGELVGVASRLARVLAGEDILVRRDEPRQDPTDSGHITDRNATILAAQALHISDWIFGKPLPTSSKALQTEDSDDPVDDAKAGGGALITRRDLSEYLPIDFVLEDLAAGPPSLFSLRPAFRDLLSLSVRLTSAMVSVLMGGPINADPADPAKFQTRVRMQLVYPATSADPNRPAGSGKLPIAVLLHGQHSAYSVSGGTLSDKESFRGYSYLQDELARSGIASISVDTNIANATGSLIELRADLLLEALRSLKRCVSTKGDILFDRIDFDRVALMGHSRGGDAVVRAVKKNAAAAAANRFGIRTVCSLAPTDFTGGQAAAARTALDDGDVGFYTVLYGALDGDVSGRGGSNSLGGTGFRHYDRARCQKALIFTERCCHNSFNSIWHAEGVERGVRAVDRAPGKLADLATHQHLVNEFLGAQLRATLNGAASALNLFNGSTRTATGLTTAILWAFGSPIVHIDDFEKPVANLLGGARKLSTGTEIDEFGSIQIPAGVPINDHVLEQGRIVHVDTAKGVSSPLGVEMTLPAGRRDLSRLTTLALDVGAFFDTSDEKVIAAATPPGFSVALWDGTGASASAAESDFSPRMGRPFFHVLSDGTNVTALRLETLAFPLSKFSGIDLRNVVKIQVEVSPPSGHLFLDDIKLAAF